MGDTLQVPNKRTGDTSAALQADTPPQAPVQSQPRKFDLLAETQPPSGSAAPKKDTSMRLEVGNYMNLLQGGAPGVRSRQDLTLFMFNPGRHDLISQLLNTLPAAPAAGPARSLAFPSYYMGRRDSVGGSMPMDAPTRLRGDSIFLPPPTMSKYSEGETPGAGSGFSSSGGALEAPLRLNSIFSSLIQMPGSSSNLVSGQSVKSEWEGKEKSEKKDGGGEFNKEDYDKANYVKGEDVKSAPATKDTDYDDPLARDALGSIYGWDKPGPGTRTRSRRADSINQFWELMGCGTGLLAGFSSTDLSAFLSSLQGNGSIDFSNMSNEERRSSILKLIGTPDGRRGMDSITGASQGNTGDSATGNVAIMAGNRTGANAPTGNALVSGNALVPGNALVHGNPLSSSNALSLGNALTAGALSPNTRLGGHNRPPAAGSRAHLREDIFAKPPVAPKPEGDHFSPTSSLSLKSSHKYNDEAHSPRTSPGSLRVPPLDPSASLTLPPRQQYPKIGTKQSASYYKDAPVPPDAYGFDGITYGAKSYPDAAPPGGRVAYAEPSFLPQFKAVEDKTHYQFKPNAAAGKLGQAFEPHTQKQLVPAQQHAQSEDGRPLLGATKVDQLMLVIQAREKGNTGAIQRSNDGSILASRAGASDKGVLPAAVDLVGGIEKPAKDEGSGDESSEKRKRRKGKTQQCPYCFKQFSQSTHLDVHVRLHIGYKPFQCTFCYKRFTQGGNLRTHMRLHTGEKPFTCDVCGRSFSRKGNLAAHMLTHNKEKPFECKLDDCDKSFTQLGNLKSHQNKFHLPTLNSLTQTLAELSGEELEQLSDSEKLLLDYFRTLYKNSNKGIRGRGKGKRVATVSELCDATISPDSVHATPQQHPIHMASMQQMSPQSPVRLLNQGSMGSSVNYATPESQNY